MYSTRVTMLNNDHSFSDESENDPEIRYMNKNICIDCPKNIECHNIDCLNTYCKKCYAECELELLHCNIELDLQCPYCVGSYHAFIDDDDESIMVCGNCLRCSDWCKTCEIIYDSNESSLIQKHENHEVYELLDDKSYDMFIESHGSLQDLCNNIIH